MKWEIDKEAVEEAKKILGIKRPVRFVRIAMPYSIGRHWYTHAGQIIIKHQVVVRKSITVKRANNTVWHELTHCGQTERMGPDLFDKTMWKELESIGITRRTPSKNIISTPEYRSMPLEVEANNNADKYQHIMLVRPL